MSLTWNTTIAVRLRGPIRRPAVQRSSSINLIVVVKTPQRTVADVNDIITWTLTITNAGVGAAVAPNIFVTDIVESGFINVNATDGSGGDETTTANIVANTINWTPPFTLPVGGVWTAQVWAEAQDSITHTNFLDVRGDCGDGCVYDVASDTAYVTLLERFDKGPEIITDTIGSHDRLHLRRFLPDTGSTMYEDVDVDRHVACGFGLHLFGYHCHIGC